MGFGVSDLYLNLSVLVVGIQDPTRFLRFFLLQLRLGCLRGVASYRSPVALVRWRFLYVFCFTFWGLAIGEGFLLLLTCYWWDYSVSSAETIGLFKEGVHEL